VLFSCLLTGWSMPHPFTKPTMLSCTNRLVGGVVLDVIAPLDRCTEKEQTQAEVQTFILDRIYQELPQTALHS
jgi:hypothetical protein